MLEAIWDSKILTNCGPFHHRLEQGLCAHLGVPYISLFNNGTIGLIAALRALDIKGEVITTPYTFVATAHSLLWNDITPIFVDIDPLTLNIDPTKIEAAITEKTTAILPIHCYGHPCDTAAIQAIADQHGLKVIYDAAHAFGVTEGKASILRQGDLSVLSFHATKVFNTFEGGAVVCHDEETKLAIDHLKNFGFSDETSITTIGINGKMAEINSAMGILQLNHINRLITQRRAIDGKYRFLLKDIQGIRCGQQGAEGYNYAYFPIFVEEDYTISRDALYAKLKEHEIYTRRYFYPLISNIPMYAKLSSADRENLPVANRIADTVLCLPIFPDMQDASISAVIDIIRRYAG